MGAFLKHTNCEFCGSSDAMALYAGGSGFCFSCRRSLRGSISPYALKEEPEDEKILLPDDACFDYPPICIEWISKYDLTVNELIRNKVYWSTSKQQLLFTFWDDTQQLLLYQARNFYTGAKQKYFTKGKPDQILPVYESTTPLTQTTTPLVLVEDQPAKPLVLVEDCVSAIRVSRFTASLPVLGSDLSLSKLKRVEGLLGPSMGVVVWLDSDMFHKAQRMARRLQMLGVNARAIWTECDPKVYTDTQIKETLQM